MECVGLLKTTSKTNKAYPKGHWLKFFDLRNQAFYDLNIFCLAFYKGPGNNLTQKIILRAVIIFGQRIHFWGKKYRLSLLEGFRQISFYLPEQFWQISSYSYKEWVLKLQNQARQSNFNTSRWGKNLNLSQFWNMEMLFRYFAQTFCMWGLNL